MQKNDITKILLHILFTVDTCSYVTEYYHQFKELLTCLFKLKIFTPNSNFCVTSLNFILKKPAVSKRRIANCNSITYINKQYFQFFKLNLLVIHIRLRFLLST